VCSCEITGSARSLLSAERSALNFLQMMSAVATRTAAFVEAVAGTQARIFDTRKTLPGLRRAQKYAVTAGGGQNHRIGLYDGILIKENHIVAAGGIRPALEAAFALVQHQAPRNTMIEIEVETLQQLHEALDCGARLILIDNMSPDQMRDAVKTPHPCRIELEASAASICSRCGTPTPACSALPGSPTKDIALICRCALRCTVAPPAAVAVPTRSRCGSQLSV
jgi:nicotinate-nucleotide pyrophosphorylase (carboxylating)